MNKKNEKKICSIDNILKEIEDDKFNVSSSKQGKDRRIKIQEDVLAIKASGEDISNILDLFRGNDNINVQGFDGKILATFSSSLTQSAKEYISSSLETLEHSAGVFLDAPVSREDSIVDKFKDKLEFLKNDLSFKNAQKQSGLRI